MKPKNDETIRIKARKKSSTRPPAGERVILENVNVPGSRMSLDAAHYHAMRVALLKVLPNNAPGLTQTEMRAAVKAHLSADLFPDDGKIGWWAKAVQLDLEARKIITREPTRPLRWHQLAGNQ